MSKLYCLDFILILFIIAQNVPLRKKEEEKEGGFYILFPGVF